MRRALAGVYAVAALMTLVPAVFFLFAVAASSRMSPRQLAFGVLFNPMLVFSLGLGAWYGSIAWRSARPGAVVTRGESRAAEALAALLGALLTWVGVAGIAAHRASAARGGGLLGGLGELTLIVGVGYLLLAAGSFAARAFGTAPHAHR